MEPIVLIFLESVLKQYFANILFDKLGFVGIAKFGFVGICEFFWGGVVIVILIIYKITATEKFQKYFGDIKMANSRQLMLPNFALQDQ